MVRPSVPKSDGQRAQAAACAARERQDQSDLPLFRSFQRALLQPKTAFRIIRYDYQINFNANWISLFVVEVVSIKPALAIGAPVWSKRV
jgi:hypothetical protein